MAEAKKLGFNVYLADPDGGDTVLLKEGTPASDIPEAQRERLGSHVWVDDADAQVDPAAPAPPGGVTGQDPAAVPGGQGIDGADLADGTVDEVLDRVGDDKSKAQAALDAETAKGGKARSTLVEKLRAIIEAEQPPS